MSKLQTILKQAGVMDFDWGIDPVSGRAVEVDPVAVASEQIKWLMLDIGEQAAADMDVLKRLVDEL